MAKFYISSLEDLNAEEKKYNKVSYGRLTSRLFNQMILCNDIPNVDEMLFDNIEVGEIEEDTEIFQYFLVTTNFDIDYLQRFSNEIILAYSEKLDLYVLMVTHWGTSWDYVLTDVEPTTNINEIY